MSRLWLLLMLALSAAPLSAHLLAPALLQLSEQQDGSYEVLWRTSVSRSQKLDVTPLLPSSCKNTTEPSAKTEGGDALVLRWQLQCDASGLAGKVIHVQGLEQSSINVIVKVLPRQGQPVQTLLAPDQPTFTVPERQRAESVFGSYLLWGVEHLLAGLDHLLFVAGLWLLVQGRRALLITITAFTLGHSLTLGLAVLGVVQVPQTLAELGIAISILLLAQQVVMARSQASVWPTARSAWMAAGFGLLHGLGFAGALTEVGLPQGEVVMALLGFNLGIELGQLLFVAGLGLLAAVPPALAPSPRPVWQAFAGYAIGGLAGFWCIERSLSWLG